MPTAFKTCILSIPSQWPKEKARARFDSLVEKEFEMHFSRGVIQLVLDAWLLASCAKPGCSLKERHSLRFEAHLQGIEHSAPTCWAPIGLFGVQCRRLQPRTNNHLPAPTPQ